MPVFKFLFVAIKLAVCVALCIHSFTHLHELGLMWMLRNICQRSDCIRRQILETQVSRFIGCGFQVRFTSDLTEKHVTISHLGVNQKFGSVCSREATSVTQQKILKAKVKLLKQLTLLQLKVRLVLFTCRLLDDDTLNFLAFPSLSHSLSLSLTIMAHCVILHMICPNTYSYSELAEGHRKILV